MTSVTTRRWLSALALLVMASPVPMTAAADSSSTQQIVVSAPSDASTSGTLTAYQQSGGVWHAVYGPVRAQLGVHGLSDNRTEGDGTTPTGTYGFLPTMYGLADAAPNPRYVYHHLVCGDWWSGVRDATYNTFQQLACGQTMDDSEALWQQTAAYQHLAVIDFNMDPTVIGKGSAIFLHDATGSGVTAGCVAVKPSALDAVLSWLDPAQHPVIRIGTSAQVGAPTPLVVPPQPARAATATPRPAPAAARPRPTAPPTTSTSTAVATTTTTTTTTATTTTTQLVAPATVTIRATSMPSRSRAPAALVAAALLLTAAFAACVVARSGHDTNGHGEPL